MSASSQTNDLKNRIIFTIFILAVYRFGTFVPIPGIDPEQLQTMMSGNQKGLLGMFNVFSGGAVSRMAIFALGIMPYISASIIMTLLSSMNAQLKELKKEVPGYEDEIDKYKPKPMSIADQRFRSFEANETSLKLNWLQEAVLN